MFCHIDDQLCAAFLFWCEFAYCSLEELLACFVEAEVWFIALCCDLLGQSEKVTAVHVPDL